MPKGPARRLAVDRFIEKIVYADDGTDCILWVGATAKTGYGRFMMEPGWTTEAHRAAYMLFVGPIPDGMDIDHVYKRGCRHRHCVNPAHLEAVSRAVNIRRSPKVGHAKTHCNKGHSLDDALVHHGRRSCRTCNRERSAARYSRFRAA